MHRMLRSAGARLSTRRWVLLALTGGFFTLAFELARRLRKRRLERGQRAKAAEDRHIGFRWLRHEARLSRERDAEAVFRAVAAELGRRLGRAEGEHVAAHLPLGLRAVWNEETHGAGRPESFGCEELVARVQSRLGLEQPAEAETLVSIVFAWLKYLAPEERADAGAMLPQDLRELWERAQLPIVPPWRRLELPPQASRRPSLVVRFVVWEAGGGAPEEESDEIFELPAEGSRFWRRGSAFHVERIEEGKTPCVHLVRDLERESSFYEGLQEGVVFQVEQAPADGLWRAAVIAPGGRGVGSGHDDDCDVAAEAAHAEALRTLAVETGYHPEREVE